jgi:hypothetical protein
VDGSCASRTGWQANELWVLVVRAYVAVIVQVRRFIIGMPALLLFSKCADVVAAASGNDPRLAGSLHACAQTPFVFVVATLATLAWQEA